jgi:drug/metabolite transporter (DMT)-like permease
VKSSGVARCRLGSVSSLPATAARAPAREVWVALGIVYIAWGSTYVGIRYMDETVPPLIGAALRYFSAGLAMYAFLAARRRAFPRIPARELGSVTLVAILLLVGGNGFVSVAERHVPAGLAALLVASMPLWLLIMRYLSGERPSRTTFAGLVVGFVGVALLVARGGQGQGVSIPELLVVIGASLSWALGSFASSRLAMPSDAALGTALEMLIGGLVLAALGPLLGEHWHAVGHASARSWIAIAYLSVFGSILAFTAYVWLLQHAPISQVSTYAYVNPAVAVVLGAVLLSERITVVTVIGGLVILAAVAVVIRAESRPAPASAPACASSSPAA